MFFYFAYTATKLFGPVCVHIWIKSKVARENSRERIRLFVLFIGHFAILLASQMYTLKVQRLDKIGRYCSFHFKNSFKKTRPTF